MIESLKMNYFFELITMIFLEYLSADRITNESITN
jgi:hypothetical protein